MATLVSDKTKKKDMIVKNACMNKRKWREGVDEEAINKLPNELREKPDIWNPGATYHGDDYCDFYVEY